MIKLIVLAKYFTIYCCFECGKQYLGAPFSCDLADRTIIMMAAGVPTKRKSDQSTSPLLKKAKLSVASRVDVIEQKNKKRPFSKIPDGNKALSLMLSWMRAASKRFSPDKWLTSLTDKDRQLVKVAAGPSPKKLVETLTRYNRDYFLAGAAGHTVYRLAKKSEPVYVKQTLVYARTPNANGAYSLTRDERTRAAEHRDEDWEPATRMRGRGLVNTWKTTDGQLCCIPQEYHAILVRQVDAVAPPDRFVFVCVLTPYV